MEVTPEMRARALAEMKTSKPSGRPRLYQTQEEVRQAAREASRRWRENHPDQVKIISRQHLLKKKAERDQLISEVEQLRRDNEALRAQNPPRRVIIRRPTPSN